MALFKIWFLNSNGVEVLMQYIDIWNPIMRNKTWTVKAHEGMVSALAATKSNVIASVSHDQWVKLWK